MIAIMTILCSPVCAESIDLGRAKSIASAFLMRNGIATRSAVASTPIFQWDSNELSGNEQTVPTFYYFSISGGDGFVIVSGDDAVQPIIGYSTEGNVSSIDDMPQGMFDYLKSIDTDIRAMRAASLPKRADSSADIGNIIVQMETAKWGQGQPYNNQCIMPNGSKALTGCIATAFAIIMRYHKWPEYGVKAIYNMYTGEKIDITQHAYNWDNMPLEYLSGRYTSEQADEVSALMMHLGHAYMLSWSPGGTGGNHNSYRLYLHWGYEEVEKAQRWIYGDDNWITMLRSSLDNNCPVPYAATNAGTGDSKHIFVIDGYTDAGYYHFNWGWNGNGNGWYLLTDMKPSTGDDYSSKTDSHQAYFNLRPIKNEEPTEYTVTVAASEGGTATVNGASSVTATQGTELLLQATAHQGYEFFHWAIYDGALELPYSYATDTIIKVEHDTELYAYFVEETTVGNISSGTLTFDTHKGKGILTLKGDCESVHIYNAKGTLCRKLTLNGSADINLSPGIYILSSKGKKYKITIK